MFKSEIVNRWIVLQQGENHSAIDEEPKLKSAHAFTCCPKPSPQFASLVFDRAGLLRGAGVVFQPPLVGVGG
jgi:hypothetical protein